MRQSSGYGFSSREVLVDKVIFLDIDGVLLPHRAFALPGNQGFAAMAVQHAGSALPRRRTFDPVAVAMVHQLVTATGAKVVWSSSWANFDQPTLQQIVAENGLNARMFDERAFTPRWLGANRSQEIDQWLQEASKVVEWIALDNDPSLQGRESLLNKRDPYNLRRPSFSPHDGMTLGIYSQAAAILGSPESIVDWALADVSGRKRPIVFIARQGQTRLIPLLSVERVYLDGFLVADGLWYRLGNPITDTSLLGPENHGLTGIELAFKEATVETLVERFLV